MFDALASTHYVVLGFEIEINNIHLNFLPYFQYSEYDWFNEKKLLLNNFMHHHSEKYFKCFN